MNYSGTSTPLHLRYLSQMIPENVTHCAKFYLDVLQAEGSPQYFSRSTIIDLRRNRSFTTSIAVNIPNGAVPGSEYIEAQVIGKTVFKMVHYQREHRCQDKYRCLQISFLKWEGGRALQN